ncbi:MAG: IPT/TIG domain-containing protein, partial [Planctomycetes bacterium]|nr:IPT/TIG domain-containing protein [Planctomycetota bacterium]
TDDADPTWVSTGAPVLEIRAEEIIPAIVPTGGCEVCLGGTGFDPAGETEIRIQSWAAAVTSAAEDKVCFIAPPHDDGSIDVEILTPSRRGRATIRYGSLFIRGDVSGDGTIDLGDPIQLLNHLFANGTIDCPDAADGDDDGNLTIGDAVGVMWYLFGGGLSPRQPFPAAGSDPTPDGLYCGW